MTDGFRLASPFQGAGDIAADLENGLPALVQIIVLEAGIDFRKAFQVDRGAGSMGEMRPGFFGGKGKHGCHQLQQGRQDLVEGRLGGTAGGAPGCRGVEAVFEDIEVEGTEVHHAIVVQRMIHPVEFEAVIGLAHPFDQVLKLDEGKSIQLVQVAEGQGVARRLEISKIAEEKAAGVANAPVCFAQPLQNVGRDANIVAIVLRRHPQAQDFRAVLLDDLFRGDHIPERF